MSMPDFSSEAFWRCAANSALAVPMKRMAAATSLFCKSAIKHKMEGHAAEQKLHNRSSVSQANAAASYQQINVLQESVLKEVKAWFQDML